MKNKENSLTMIKKGILLGVYLVINTSCSSFLPDRSYIEEMERESDPFFQAGKDFPVVGGDNGNAYRSRDEIKKRTPASERDRNQIKEQESIRQELLQKEAELPEEFLGQYSKDKRYLSTDSDKLYYLSLSQPERNGYISVKKQDIQEDQGKGKDFMEKHSIRSAELYLGMPKSQVVEIWGKPARIEIAGNPKNQNERWSFLEDGSLKQVYFEAGKVQGWALDL